MSGRHLRGAVIAMGALLVGLYTGRAFRERVPPRYGEAG